MIEIKNAFDGFISRLDMIKKRINDLEEMLVKTSQIIQQRKKRIKYVTECPRTGGQKLQYIHTRRRRKGIPK